MAPRSRARRISAQNESTKSRGKKQNDEPAARGCIAVKGDEFIRKIHARPINDRYLLVRKLGEGGFGLVFLGRDCTDGKEVALKLEHRSIVPSILEDEAKRCRELSNLQGFPDVYWYGWHDDYKVMAFELLGPSLEDLFAFCAFEFSLKTVLMVGDQLLRRLEALHSGGVLHRDIKPQNCLMGSGTKGNVIYITDFGLAQDASPSDDRARTASTRPQLIGTARYASVTGHEGGVQSFKDDLESLGYMLIYFLRGDLPWQGLRSLGKEREAQVMELKKSLSIEELCAGLPEELAMYMEEVQVLKHGELPMYTDIRKLFRERARKEGFEYDCVFDWTELLYVQGERENERR